MLVAQNDDTYRDEFDMNQLRAEWEEEAGTSTKTSDRTQDPQGDYSFFTDAGNEDQARSRAVSLPGKRVFPSVHIRVRVWMTWQ